MGARQLAVPSASTCFCCSFLAGAVGSLCGRSLPSGSLVWVPEQIIRCAELCILCKNSAALCFSMFGANENGIFMLLMWSCCKHTLPLHVDKSDLFGTGFHWVFRSWNYQGEAKACSLIYSSLYPWLPRHHFSAVFPPLASPTVLLGLLPSWSTGTCPIRAFVFCELCSDRSLTSQSLSRVCMIVLDTCDLGWMWTPGERQCMNYLISWAFRSPV